MRCLIVVVSWLDLVLMSPQAGDVKEMPCVACWVFCLLALLLASWLACWPAGWAGNNTYQHVTAT
jgi:hypothetical protein